MVKKKTKKRLKKKKPISKNNRPMIHEYFGLDAEAYAHSQWMERNQRKTTLKAIELLNTSPYFEMEYNSETKKEEIGDSYIESKLCLDLGCGSGFSSLELIHFFSRVIGLDFSRDMIKFIPNNNSLHLVQADLRALPFRSNLFSTVISISAYNFVSEGAKNKNQINRQIYQAFKDLIYCIGDLGKIVIEFYPTPLEEEIFFQVLKKFPIQGGMLKTDPGTRKEKKFLLLRKISSDLD
ncbi:MAG: class I SAM-dependent methyltransferase [Candidatus Lokiarchaeota archaeon]|nr:class I SAM-dependent methyltransferase [Candidatus Harpocratesius repetitus]